ncbi:MAG: hypothetical protein KZQ81_19040 [Candidatus Thiodiazotropha sp. (ex Rostrolucina anterorostrata)]|nr:hypothetical protein [Candidatus Thiodiazotropha sp. (ex Rostrolucina anterorostrata)]
MTTHKAPEPGDDQLSPSRQSQLQKLLEQELKRPVSDKPGSNARALVGRLEGFGAEGYPVVVFNHDGKAVRRTARSAVALSREHAGRECLIQLCCDPDTPVISGLIQPPLSDSASDETAITCSDERIRLQCGDAYIELTAEGTVRIRGDYVESVAYGANRLKGSSVKIN